MMSTESRPNTRRTVAASVMVLLMLGVLMNPLSQPSWLPEPTVIQPTGASWSGGSYKGRGFQFKAELQSQDPAQNILIDQLGYNATFQRRQEQSTSAVASGTSTASVTFDNAFFTGTASLGGTNAYLPSVGITVQNLGAGERVNVSNVTATGFDVDVLDSGGSNVDRNFIWQAVGYGKAV